eukprot:jgi/Chlat1/4391/Chrsp29S04529
MASGRKRLLVRTAAASALQLVATAIWFLGSVCGWRLDRVWPQLEWQFEGYSFRTSTADFLLASVLTSLGAVAAAATSPSAEIAYVTVVALPLLFLGFSVAKLVAFLIGPHNPASISLAALLSTIALIQLGWAASTVRRLQRRQRSELEEPLLGENRPTKKIVSALRLLQLCKPDACMLAIAFVFLTLAACFEVAIPNAVARLLTVIVIKPEHDKFKLYTAVLAALSVGAAFASAVRGILMSIVNYRLLARLRQSLFDAIISKEIAMFDNRGTGELSSRLNADTITMGSAITLNINILLRNSIQAIGGMAYLIYLSPLLSLIITSAILVFFATVATYARFVKRYQAAIQDAIADGNKVAEETFSLIRVVRAFSSEEWEKSRFHVYILKGLMLGYKQAYAYGLYACIVLSITNLAITLLLLVGGTFVYNGKMSGATLTTYMFYAQYISDRISGLGEQVAAIARALGASDKVFELMDGPPCEAVVTRGLEPKEKPVGEITFDNVCFFYPTRPTIQVLSGLSFTINKGETVALVGPSGGGKSTITHLCLRHYEPTGGRILFDGHELRKLDLQWLHRQTAVVSQEPLLFSVDIKSNIAYGMPSASMADIEAAARLANAHEFIEKLPNKYDTLVGEKGVALSGGQKQRLAISRAILRKPALLLLDEATSALDAENEALVQEALERASASRSVLVIAHRLSTIANADKILVISKGRVAESGTHSELFARGGIYSSLVHRQMHDSSHQDLRTLDANPEAARKLDDVFIQ